MFFLTQGFGYARELHVRAFWEDVRKEGESWDRPERTVIFLFCQG